MIEETLLLDQPPKAEKIVTGLFVRRPCPVNKTVEVKAGSKFSELAEAF